MASTNLFSGSKLSEYLSDRHDMIRRSVAKKTTEAELDDYQKDVAPKYAISPVTLDRAGAQFESANTEGAIKVSLTVLFDGKSDLLSHAPDGYQRPQVYAELNDDRSWLSDDKRKWIRFGRTVPDTSADEIRAWAKGQVDEVEAALAAQAPQIEEFNASLPGFVREVVEARRAILRKGDSLQDELGSGI